MKKNFLYPASFFVKENSSGIYCSTYPIVFPSDGNPSFDDAVILWKFWHPETKLLYMSKKYLSYKTGDGLTTLEFLKKNKMRIKISGSEEDPSDEYSFLILPLTFTNNSLGAEKSYSEWDNGILSERTKYYHSKLIYFGTESIVQKYSDQIIPEWLDWWQEKGKNNLEEYEERNRDLNNGQNYSEPAKNGDSWMDDPENYWNID
jgi:hypothetical protein